MGIIFDIQPYAIYDGPGIRTTIFFKGCPLTCSWCHNPESQRKAPEVSYAADRCTGCGCCVEECPTGSLSLVSGAIVRDRTTCTACGACARVCPGGAAELIGKDVEPAYIVSQVTGDKPFFDKSGGGVTISGGEPTMQPDFLFETLSLIKENGIHTALETSGYFNDDLVPELVRYADLFLFDIKHTDSDLHKKFTGVRSEPILKNFRRLTKSLPDGRLIPRIPLIPGCNTDEKSIDGMIDFFQEAGHNGPVHLMPYNPLAKSKYEKVGMEKRYRDFGRLTDEMRKAITTRMNGAGLPTFLNE
jgi:pyruvate formate lyase activating enzyme